MSAGCGDGVRLQGIRAPRATLPAPKDPQGLPRVLPGPLSPGLDRPVVERKKTSAAMEDQASGTAKEGRKPQPHALQPSEVPVVF